MKVTVGRFSGYVADKNPVDILLALLSSAKSSLQGRSVEPSFLHRFVYEMKKEAPELLKDVSFSESSFLPYSKEIDQALHELQGAGFLLRPNSVYAPFDISASDAIFADWMTDEDKAAIRGFAEELNQELRNAA